MDKEEGMKIDETTNLDNDDIESLNEGELNSPLSTNISLEKADR